MYMENGNWMETEQTWNTHIINEFNYGTLDLICWYFHLKDSPCNHAIHTYNWFCLIHLVGGFAKDSNAIEFIGAHQKLKPTSDTGDTFANVKIIPLNLYGVIMNLF